MTEKYRVFPDYCSTGIWSIETGANLDPEECDLTAIECVALKYWHSYWETLPNGLESEFHDENGEFLQDKWDANELRLGPYVKRWIEDGRKIVDSINNRIGIKLFRYEVENYGQATT